MAVLTYEASISSTSQVMFCRAHNKASEGVQAARSRVHINAAHSESAWHPGSHK